MSAREITVTVTLRWEGDRLMLRGFEVGNVTRYPGQFAYDGWTGDYLDRFPQPPRGSGGWGIKPLLWGPHPTREAAMEAVETAVIKTLGGKETTS